MCLIAPQKIEVVTFGQPRIGNRAWADYVAEILPGRVHRITRAQDPVPHVGTPDVPFLPRWMQIVSPPAYLGALLAWIYSLSAVPSLDPEDYHQVGIEVWMQSPPGVVGVSVVCVPSTGEYRYLACSDSVLLKDALTLSSVQDHELRRYVRPESEQDWDDMCLVSSTVSSAGSCAIDAGFGQRGATIDGTDAYGHSGESVALSSNGNTVAVGAPGANNSAGQTRVFDWSSSSWVQRGADIDGTHLVVDDGDSYIRGDKYGSSVALSSNGNTVAIGAPGIPPGRTRVFDWNSSAWVLRGAEIVVLHNDSIAFSIEAHFGESIALSSDGNTVAIAAYNQGSDNPYVGHTRVLDWNGSSWVQRGVGMEVESFGSSYDSSKVAMSSNGNTVAIGVSYDSSSSLLAGRTRVFDWSGSAWVQRGAAIDGELALDFSGASVALSSDGNIVAIGATTSGVREGHARVFNWSGSAWVQSGANIEGERMHDRTGYSVTLSSDGNTVAIGAPGSNYCLGYTRVLDWNASAWVKRGPDIIGEEDRDCLGMSVALSSDGNIIAVGAPHYESSSNRSGRGRARVFCLASRGLAPTPTRAPSPPPMTATSFQLVSPPMVVRVAFPTNCSQITEEDAAGMCSAARVYYESTMGLQAISTCQLACGSVLVMLTFAPNTTVATARQFQGFLQSTPWTVNITTGNVTATGSTLSVYGPNITNITTFVENVTTAQETTPTSLPSAAPSTLSPAITAAPMAAPTPSPTALPTAASAVSPMVSPTASPTTAPTATSTVITEGKGGGGDGSSSSVVVIVVVFVVGVVVLLFVAGMVVAKKRSGRKPDESTAADVQWNPTCDGPPMPADGDEVRRGEIAVEEQGVVKGDVHTTETMSSSTDDIATDTDAVAEEIEGGDVDPNLEAKRQDDVGGGESADCGGQTASAFAMTAKESVV